LVDSRPSIATLAEGGLSAWLCNALLVGVVVIGGRHAAGWAQEIAVADDPALSTAGAIVSDVDSATAYADGAWRPVGHDEQTVEWQGEAGQAAGVPVMPDVVDPSSDATERPLEGQLGLVCETETCDVPTMDVACCEQPRWSHCCRVFGEFLYVRPRDADVIYAMPVDGPVTPPGNPGNPGNQVGPAGVVDPDYQPAYRVGFESAWSDCVGVVATFTQFESATSNAVAAAPGNYIQSQVTHPGVLNAEDNWLEGAATLDVDYRLIDVDYRWLVARGECHAVNLLAGARYGRMREDFYSHFAINGTRDVETHLQFEGGGLRLGIDAERYAPCRGWMVYGRGHASFVVGDYRGSYFQGSSFAATEIDTAWKSGRIVSMLDLELGVGWRGPCDRLRLKAGYLVSGWLNAVGTDEWIDAVNANNLAGLGGSDLTFDGFTASAEFRF
jgi:hypothetical protein